MQYTEQLITPGQAIEMLKCNADNNRSPKRGKITAYARDMLAGRWVHPTGEAIKFDVQGRLIDGQNRLAAVVEADVPVMFTVFRNVSLDAMPVLDSGAGRSFGDVMAVASAPNRFHVGTVVRWINAWDREPPIRLGRGGGYSPSHSELLGVYWADSGAFDAAGSRGKDMNTAGLGNPGAAGTAHYLFSRLDSEQTKIFFDRVISGANLNEGEPELMLRNRLAKGRRQRGGDTRQDQLALYVRAWNARREGRALANLVASTSAEGLTNENFPIPR